MNPKTEVPQQKPSRRQPKQKNYWFYILLIVLAAVAVIAMYFVTDQTQKPGTVTLAPSTPTLEQSAAPEATDDVAVQEIIPPQKIAE